jgi:hypothetical protein
MMAVEATYRYTLTRTISLPVPRSSARTLCWVMLNPSTADETTDDPTIRRVKRFTYDNGFDKLIVVNLFAMRATDPADLYDAACAGCDPVGSENRTWIAAAMLEAQAVVCAWGASMNAALFEHPDIRVMCDNYGHVPMCLGLTRSGAPRHPLYVAASQPFVPWVKS